MISMLKYTLKYTHQHTLSCPLSNTPTPHQTIYLWDITGFPAIFSMSEYPPQHTRCLAPSLKYTQYQIMYLWDITRVPCYDLHVEIPPQHTRCLSPSLKYTRTLLDHLTAWFYCVLLLWCLHWKNLNVSPMNASCLTWMCHVIWMCHAYKCVPGWYN